MKFKNKLIKGLAISMAFSMLFTTNAFATPIDLANSAQDVKNDTLNQDAGTTYYDDESTNEWNNGTIPEEVRVKVDLASQFTITIPKEIVLDGEAKKANYQVNVKGDIAGDQKVSVMPDADFQMNEAGGKADVTATVTQPDTDFTYDQIKDAGKTVDGIVEAEDMTAGDWSGSFFFNIKFEGGEGQNSVKTLNDYTWAEIAAISESGEAANYFSVGDEKTVEIGAETYTLQVMGFNHDELADGSGKAGITLGLKEIMTTTAKMNDTNTNVGGWEGSKMRTYLQNDLLPSLPQDLQDIIKTVNKKTSAGNQSTEIITSEDKLFLFSEVEIFGTTTYSASGEGEQYQYYTDGGSKVRNYLTGSSNIWWERSPYVSYTYGFCIVNDSGIASSNRASRTYGVVFGLSI